MLNLLGSIVSVCHETGFAMNTVNNGLDGLRLAFPQRWAVLRSTGTQDLRSWNRDSSRDLEMQQLSRLKRTGPRPKTGRRLEGSRACLTLNDPRRMARGPGSSRFASGER